MMMNRDRLGFWTRLLAIGLAAVFIFSGIFFGMGSGISYSPMDLFGGGDQQPGGQTVDQQELLSKQTEEAEKDLEKNPDDPEKSIELAGLYFQDNRFEDATKVLEEGRKQSPKNGEIPMLLGQTYAQRAQAVADEKERKELQMKSAESFGEAAELEPENEQAFLFAGESYNQVGESGQAIKYWNGYLDLEPEGEQSKQVRQSIEDTLQGGSTTGSS